MLLGMAFPGGFAIGPDDAAYIANFGTSATGGEALRLPVAVPVRHWLASK